DPDSRDGKLHDRDGNLVLSRLNSESLSLLARRTGGFYTTGSARHFSENLEVAVARLDKFEMEGLKRRIAIPRFQWFLVPSMILFVVGMMLNTSWRSAAKPVAGLLLMLAAWAQPARSEAGLIPRTRAEQAYAEGDHLRALDLFGQEVAAAHGERRPRLQLGEAAAAYRLGKFGRASRAYSGALLSRRKQIQEHAHYGLGNTQFYQGLRILEGSEKGRPPDLRTIEATILYWRDAIGHFEGALALSPGNTMARENRDRVQERLNQLLEEQKRQQEDPQSPQPPPDTQPPPEEKPEEDPRPNRDPSDPGRSPPNGQPEGPQDPGSPPREQNPEQPERQPGQGEDEPESARDPLPSRPGESPEEYARRILNENADFQDRPVPLRFRNPPRSEKDW
ncbi:MAG: hypothetical protein GWO24_24445, partial [Akkermansiaceae bacterium]|nr:hypothetical protein [Akkermansiaceae bacterium]